MLRTVGVVGLVALGIVGGLGCQPKRADFEPFQAPELKDYSRPLPPGELALRKIDPKDYPDFSAGFNDQAGLREAIRGSLAYLAKKSSQRYFPYGDITHARAVASLQEFLVVLDEARSPAELDRLIRERFEVYQSIGCDDRGTVYYTGYYCPIFDGRKRPSREFCYPLYSLPPDLVKDEEGQTLGRRTAAGTLEPYPTRREIEEGALLRGREIAWLRDPFQAYVVTVQGSAKLRLEDGTQFELGYAGNNGHEYTPVGRILVADGHIGSNELSLQRMLDYFSRHPDRVYDYCWQNARYVFFKETPGGPFGSLNVAVTPFRSIATDKEVFPRACLAFARTHLPRYTAGGIRALPFESFVLDHDTGGAIRAAGRSDVYMGIGPHAEALAGRTGAEGQLYYLFIRPGGYRSVRSE